MVGSNVCRICHSSCSDSSIQLCDASGCTNEIYSTAIKYFPPMILDVEMKTTNSIAVLCTQCWQQISSFDGFQQSVVSLYANCQGGTSSSVTNNYIELLDSVTKMESTNDLRGQNVIIYEDDSGQNEMFERNSNTTSESPGRDVSPEENYDENAMHVDEQLMDQSDGDTFVINELNEADNTSANQFSTKNKSQEEIDDTIAKWRPILTCEYCPQTFSTFTLLKEHFNVAHNNDPFYVQCCWRKLKYRCHVYDHAVYHLNPDAFKCQFCVRRFNSSFALNFHIMRNHNDVNDIAQNKTQLIATTTATPGASTTAIPFEIGYTNEDIMGRDGDEFFVVNELNETDDKSLERKSSPLSNDADNNIDVTTDRRGACSQREMDEVIAKWRPLLKCEACPIYFSTFTLLKTHFLADHPNEEFYISCCGRKFKHRYRVEEHALQHINPTALKCQLCGKCYSTRHGLAYHLSHHHKGEHVPGDGDDEESHLTSSQTEIVIELNDDNSNINCSEDTLSFNDIFRNFILGRNNPEARKEMDMIIAKWRPLLKCRSCRKSFPTFTLVKTHFNAEHPNEDFYVECCGRKLRYRYRLEEHAILHMNPKGIKCLLCGKCFTTRYHLNDHMTKLHPDAKFSADDSFECSQCGLRCGDDATLVEHVKIHTNKVTYDCQYCAKSYDNEIEMNMHLVRSHPEHDPNIVLSKCEYCPRAFRLPQSLHMHRQRCHPTEWEHGKI
ncbi:uncharacterized protein isoform X1 [Musca autumnalis]|uniref:uncharacterized protein isoform X1 n=1 Tax=Musca autumnalis TaxID=221902 RepID=UPI003CF90EDA